MKRTLLCACTWCAMLSSWPAAFNVRAADASAPVAVVAEDAKVTSTKLYREGLEIQRQTQDLKTAIARWQAALELDPDNADCLNHYSWFLAVDAPAELRAVDRAIVMSLHAAKVTQEKRPDILDTVAESYFQNKDLPHAVEYGRKALLQQCRLRKPTDYYITQLLKFEDPKNGGRF